MNERNFKMAYLAMIVNEGGYTDGKNQIKDEATNMGIRQTTLNRFNSRYPDLKMPHDVKDLNPTQVCEIYRLEYWAETKIPFIKNDRIRNAVFDMNVMGAVGAGKTVQCALNRFLGTKLIIDGIIGDKTIVVLNSVPDDGVDDFMQMLKECRIKNLQSMINWPTAHRGWIQRTDGY